MWEGVVVLELSPGRWAGSLSAGGQESQDEAMSDGWNHAGRSGAEHPLQEGGQQWLEVSLAFGMDNGKKQKSSHRDPEKWGQMWAGDRHRACVWGQGR